MRRLATAAACLVHSLAAASQLPASTAPVQAELHWCQWGPWSVPLVGCGAKAGLYARFRQRCCNSSLKRVSNCRGESDEQRRQTPFLPCSNNPSDDLGGHSDFLYTGTITPLISALACVGLLLSCCLLIARRRHQYRAMAFDRSLPGSEFTSHGPYGPQFHLGFSMSLTVRAAAQDSPPPPYELASRQNPPVPPPPPPPSRSPPRSPPPLYEEVMSQSQTANVQHDRAS